MSFSTLRNLLKLGAFSAVSPASALVFDSSTVSDDDNSPFGYLFNSAVASALGAIVASSFIRSMRSSEDFQSFLNIFKSLNREYSDYRTYCSYNHHRSTISNHVVFSKKRTNKK